ncbi:unnamed protein product [Calypogeia fissa]
MHGNVFLQYYNTIKDKHHSNGTFADPGQEKDQLYQTVCKENKLETKVVERPIRQPSERTQVWYGSIGSGDKLVKNAQKRDELRDKFDLIGLETKAAGTINTIPVGVIRGVCDYGDAQKNKEWQPHTAAYAKAVLYKIRPKRNRRDEALHALKAQATQEAPLARDDSEARLIKDYSEIAKRAKLSPDLKGEGLLHAVQQWIEQKTNWLVVFDNVDKLSILKESVDRRVDKERLPSPRLLRFVPKGPSGTVIWTSRDGAIPSRLVSVDEALR